MSSQLTQLTWPGFVLTQLSGLLYTEPLGSCSLPHSSREPLEYFSDYSHRNAGAITVMPAASRVLAFCQRFIKHPISVIALGTPEALQGGGY